MSICCVLPPFCCNHLSDFPEIPAFATKKFYFFVGENDTFQDLIFQLLVVADKIVICPHFVNRIYPSLNAGDGVIRQTIHLEINHRLVRAHPRAFLRRFLFPWSNLFTEQINKRPAPFVPVGMYPKNLNQSKSQPMPHSPEALVYAVEYFFEQKAQGIGQAVFL